MGVLAIVALLGFGMFKSEPSLAVGDPAPDAPLPLLEGTGEAALADFRGEWVLVNFWASWCKPCEHEAPDIQSFLEDHADDDLVVLGVDTRDSSDAGRAFVDEHELTWEFVRDGDGERSRAWATTGLPESFLVDPEGDVALICRRPLDRAQLDALVLPFLETGGAGSARLALCESEPA